MNLYSYVYNDPLNGTDPTGEWAHLVIGGGIGLVAGLVSEAIEVSIGGGEPSWGGFIGAGLGGATTGTMMAACAGTCAAGAGAAGAALDSTLRQGINNTIDTGSLVEGVGSIDFNEVGTETVVGAAAGGLSKIPLANKIDDKLIDKVGLGGRGGPDHVARSQMTRMAHDVSDKVSVATAKKNSHYTRTQNFR